MKTCCSLTAMLLGATLACAAQPIVLKPARVFDGVAMHEQWAVVIDGELISWAGPIGELKLPAQSRVIELAGCTVLPGLIDAHTHVLLHPYDETSWDDQVLKEPLGLRVCRATNHLRKILDSGFTTIRDLGSEGADYADVGIKQAVEQKIVPGPRMLVATRAIVASRSYAPRGLAPEVRVPQGAEEADGDGLRRVVREQIGRGADCIKIYADAWDPNTGGSATFTDDEWRIIVDTAKSLNRPVVAHAQTKEGMRRAANAGVQTIEHGYGGDLEVFRLMASRGVGLCPTLAAAEAMARYRGWRTDQPEPKSLRAGRSAFKIAREAGVVIVNGSDMGVFAHGHGARELELLVEYGMTPTEALRTATAVAAKSLRLDESLGTIAKGNLADVIAVAGNPAEKIASVRQIRLVVKGGGIVRGP